MSAVDIPRAPRVDRITLTPGHGLAAVWSQAVLTYTTGAPSIRLSKAGSANAAGTVRVPVHWSGMTVKVLWVCESAGTGTLGLRSVTRALSAGVVLVDATVGTAVNPSVPATAATQVESTLGTVSVSGGELRSIGVRRDVTSGDSESANIHVLAVILERA